jgi:predicted acyltransferase
MAEENIVAGEPTRLTSVDVFRGMTIVAMILVNNPGDFATVYWPLEHAQWHGWTPTDLVFPFFLFIVGVAIVLALKRRVDAGIPKRPLVVKIVKRSAIIFGLGLFLNGYPFGLFGAREWAEVLDTWRIPGVLQRIAVCYLVVSLLVLFCRVRTLVVLTAAFLLGYWALMTLVPVPGLGAPNIDDPGGHLSGWIDRIVFGDHVWQGAKVYDPEGILSTIPALATTLFGVFAGLILVSAKDPVEKVARLFVVGSLLVGSGYIWNWFFPINKPIWTSSYAVFTAGFAFCGLALCLWFFDIHGEKVIARVFVIYGVNAIVLFVGSGIIARTLNYATVGGVALKKIIYDSVFVSWLPSYPASLAYAITWILGWFLILAWMFRRRLIVKI